MATKSKSKGILSQTQVSIMFAAARQEAELQSLRASNVALIEMLNQTRTVLGDD